MQASANTTGAPSQGNHLGNTPFNHALMVGESSVLHAVKEVAASVAGRRSTVLVLGETGTGKEMLARYIHQHSDRNDRPFVPVDCSAITETLFESQLFGHVRGAFTGAIRDNIGFIRSADGGTLFLDEVGELSLPLQAKLLRALQERAITPVGSTRAVAVDVRVISATNRDLSAMIRAGQFREDLYFRLNVIAIHLPPLRERIADILPLVRYFLAQQAALYGESVKRLTDDATDLLCRYAWPGNVRELANVIEHAHVLSQGDAITAADLPPRMARVHSEALSGSFRLADLERDIIAEALKRTGQNKAAAARLLGLNIQRLNRKISKFNINKD